jgi:hypothetical protein
VPDRSTLSNRDHRNGSANIAGRTKTQMAQAVLQNEPIKILIKEIGFSNSGAPAPHLRVLCDRSGEKFGAILPISFQFPAHGRATA